MKFTPDMRMSSSESTADVSTARLPVSSPVTNFMVASATAVATDTRAAATFGETGLMKDPQEGGRRPAKG